MENWKDIVNRFNKIQTVNCINSTLTVSGTSSLDKNKELTEDFKYSNEKTAKAVSVMVSYFIGI